MSTPSYKGPNQPPIDNGFWSAFGSWFGGDGTPAYQGEGQPSSNSSGFFGGSAPAYKSAPTSGVSALARSIDPTMFPPGSVVIVPRGVIPPSDVIDPQQ